MTFPAYIHLGPVVLHPHVVFEALAYSSGYYLYRRQRRSGDVVDARARWWIVGAAILGGFIGSHLLAAFEEPSRSLTHWPQLRLVFAGKTIVGGLIGALLTVEWAKRLLGITVATGDLFAVPLILGIGIGRIGCFLSGLEDQSYGIRRGFHGASTSGMESGGIPHSSTRCCCSPAWVECWSVDRASNATVGDRFKCFMVAYMGCRLLVDLIKPAVRFGGSPQSSGRVWPSWPITHRTCRG